MPHIDHHYRNLRLGRASQRGTTEARRRVEPDDQLTPECAKKATQDGGLAPRHEQHPVGGESGLEPCQRSRVEGGEDELLMGSLGTNVTDELLSSAKLLWGCAMKPDRAMRTGQAKGCLPGDRQKGQPGEHNGSDMYPIVQSMKRGSEPIGCTRHPEKEGTGVPR